MRQSNLALLVIAVVLTLLRLSTSASAEPSNPLVRYKPTSATALARFEAGNRFYKRARANRSVPDAVRDLRRAVDEYTAGRAVEDAPAFDYNCARAARLLDDPAKAVAHLQRFIDRAQPDEPLRQAVENEIVELDPSGAIRADLRRAKAPTESQPMPVSVPPTAPPQGPSAAPPPSQAGGTVTATASAPPLAARATARPRPSRVWAYLGWGLTAASVIGAGTSTWLAFDAAARDRDAQDVGRPTSDRLELQRQADSRRRGALILGIGSGTALVLGILTLVLPARADAASTDTAWNLGITGNGVAVFGSF